ncbi:hypothetical protein CC85DRAFT_282124 [Cutaneotrichosporon oleaginosum]|uniref:DNA damage-responsive protein 48 n=1 Tax=Cutaneotrichosporon oleaginosum TaxID=879819 RepID=A0A0J0XY60_9TREE|nr:uncharacterized protein CC85DRAFT_282124 [Cutaneotrichosporon oleaginosum]KLT45983.1 hypothetical protein CC85DRAFT_282124 [Cutaneotrichosporon oleaginosum]TXT06677.1 hypothetical protein COLE_06008 [Cutaneotrichosporon oleaginosum]
MDFLKNAAGSLGQQGQQQPQEGQQQQQQQQGGGGLGGLVSGLTSGGNIGDKLNSMGGGGAQGEANEDYLDKGVDMVQQHVLGQGPQDNESAAEQAKDEIMSDMIRDRYKGMTGSDFPIADKEQKFGQM